MTPQSSIAHYRIVSKLGEGGMGAVYRATDTKLNRDVAIKVLPDSFAADPDRYARFTREAQVLAAKPIALVTTAADESFGQFSPDGKWFAYSSDETGRREVYVREFTPDRVPAAGAAKWLVSVGGGDKPRWRRDGRELFYLSPDSKLMATTVKTAPAFEPGIPAPLFDVRATGSFPYDVAADGRFLINTPLGNTGEASAPITVVLNWTAAFRK
jgi:dipeptidyl aminopeptidase/acylaminoacyl peptidase